MFDGSDMRCWLDLNNVPYTILDNESLGLKSEKDIKAEIRKTERSRQEGEKARLRGKII